MFCLLMATVSQLRWWHDFFCWSLYTSLNISGRFRKDKKLKSLKVAAEGLNAVAAQCILCVHSWKSVTNCLKYPGFLPAFQCKWMWPCMIRKNRQVPWLLSWDCGSEKVVFFHPVWNLISESWANHRKPNRTEVWFIGVGESEIWFYCWLKWVFSQQTWRVKKHL